jgi:hypothetical protein
MPAAMYTLANDALTVTVLDPLTDRARFGTRYCTGGYIFQVDDAQRGPLLSGPNYPDSFVPYNGQGIPDAFNLSPLAEPKAGGPLALIVGIGLCDLVQDIVVDFCAWQVEQTPGAIVMRTTQAFQGFALSLERTVALNARTVRSTTRLANTGQGAIPIRWFPHPFYPQPLTDELCRFNLPVGLPENPGYVQSPSGFIARQAWPDGRGFFQGLDLDAQAPLVVLQKHPVLGLAVGICSYVPTFLPIWGNENTFSWEPYFERMTVAGQTAVWWVDYEF